MTSPTTQAPAASGLGDLLGYILIAATRDDLDRIHAACRDRAGTLRAVAAAQVHIGATVSLRDISPAYLAGLTGTVEALRGKRADVRLDEASTDLLRWKSTRFDVGTGPRFLLRGVPASSLAVAP